MPRLRIDGTYRARYGLPRDDLGRSHQKDAIDFYNQFCRQIWEDALYPPTFVITKEKLEIFATRTVVGRGSWFTAFPDDRSPNKAELRLRMAELCSWRLSVNRATCSGNVGEVILWPYCIEPEVNGKTYRVMTLETRNANGRDLDAIEGFIEAKNNNCERRMRAIKEENISIDDLRAFLHKGQQDDKTIRGLLDNIKDGRLRIVNVGGRRLLKWKRL